MENLKAPNRLPPISGCRWGVESLSRQERFAKAIDAAVDQIGGTNNPDAIVACIKSGTISRDRAEMAARRILEQKFSMGLFEDPYVDDAAAGKISGFGGDPHSASVCQRTSGVFFGGRQHEGRLNYIDPIQTMWHLWRRAKPYPQCFVTTLERPLILTNAKDKTTALLGDFGIDSKELLEILLGRANPQGHLLFELPSSINGVMKQNGAEPHDSASPLFAYGYGLSY